METSKKRWLPAASRWAALLALLVAQGVAAHEPPRQKLEFEPPAPGSYRLERIMRAPDGAVVDVGGRRVGLSAYTRGKITLLSLMYTGCSDENGCPLAYYSIALVKRDLEKSAGAARRVRLVSLSFDPEHDTPEVMRAYGGKHATAGTPLRWHFLTTASRKEAAPVLDGFGQDVSRPATGGNGRDLVHVLKVYLIDRDGWVREIYTTSYLAPAVVVNDIKTLLLEEGVKVN